MYANDPLNSIAYFAVHRIINVDADKNAILNIKTNIYGRYIVANLWDKNANNKVAIR